MKDTITILTCYAPNALATKRFTMSEEGTIKKQSYSAGMDFLYEERPVSCLADLHSIICELQTEPKKFIIRGKPKPDAEEIVCRRIHNAGAAFDAHPRYWLMLDVDKVPYPDDMNVATNPSQVIGWLKGALPAPFNSTQCVYKFSSSQNLPEKPGDASQKTVSAHLYFWCDKPVAEDEWKRFFKGHKAPIDYALFNPVQPHFTANPVFNGMSDPMPERVGIC